MTAAGSRAKAPAAHAPEHILQALPFTHDAALHQAALHDGIQGVAVLHHIAVKLPTGPHQKHGQLPRVNSRSESVNRNVRRLPLADVDASAGGFKRRFALVNHVVRAGFLFSFSVSEGVINHFMVRAAHAHGGCWCVDAVARGPGLGDPARYSSQAAGDQINPRPVSAVAIGSVGRDFDDRVCPYRQVSAIGHIGMRLAFVLGFNRVARFKRHPYRYLTRHAFERSYCDCATEQIHRADDARGQRRLVSAGRWNGFGFGFDLCGSRREKAACKKCEQYGAASSLERVHRLVSICSRSVTCLGVGIKLLRAGC